MALAKKTTRGRKSTTTTERKKYKTVKVQDFKDYYDIETLNIIRNPNGDQKLFVSLDEEHNIRCQQDLDIDNLNKENLRILWTRDDEDYTQDSFEENLNNFCLILVDPSKLSTPLLSL